MLWNPAPVVIFDSAGRPVPYAQAWFYEDGTTDLAAVYSDPAYSDELTNPVIASAAGVLPQVHLDDTIIYRCVVTGPDGDTSSPLYEADGIGGAARPSAPIDPESGASYAATLGDAGRTLKRTHTANMTDTLLAAATAGNGYWIELWNATTTRTLTISVSGGGTIDGEATFVLRPGQRTRFTSDGDEYTANKVPRVIGVYQMDIPAGALDPRITNGPSYSHFAIAGENDAWDAYAYDATTEETATIKVRPPNGWDGGAVGVEVLWTDGAGGAGSVGETCSWGVKGRLLADGSALDFTYGTEAVQSDALGLISDTGMRTERFEFTPSNPSSATSRWTLVVAVSRKASTGTIAGDVRLLDLTLFFNLVAEDDT